MRPRRALVLAPLALAAAGCVSTVPYEPNVLIVDILGPEEASRHMKEILARTVEPQIGRVEVSAESFDYQLRSGPGGSRISFAHIDRIDLYENDYVYVYAPGNVFLAKFLFAGREDALKFIDIVMSFRERARRSPPPAR